MRASWTLGIAAACALLLLLLWREREDGADADARGATPAAAAPLPSFAMEPQPAPVVAVAPDAAPLAAVPEAPPAEAETILAVRHADGVPARGCVVALATGTEVAWFDVANEQGEVRGASVAGPAVAWVEGASFQPARFDLPDARGRHELVLPEGEVIEGRIEIAGGPPPEPIALGLIHAADAHLEVTEGVPHLWIPRPGFANTSLDESCGQLVGTDGRFRFSGLPAGWVGRFETCWVYYPDDEAEMEVAAPARERVLRLNRVPHLRFRAVSAETGVPIPFATAFVTLSAEHNSIGATFTCDAEGRGDMAMVRWEPTLSAEIDAASPDGTARAKRRFELPGDGLDADVGDIALAARWTIPFRVTDVDGAPLAGAVGGTECEGLLKSQPTEADGLGRVLGVPPGCPTLRVVAPRHALVSVALPPQLPADPLEVVLPRVPWLTVDVASSDGQPRPGLVLHRDTELRISAADQGSAFHEAALAVGVNIPETSGTTTGREEVRQPDGSVLQKRRASWHLWKLGRSDLGSATAGTPVDLALTDATDHPLWSQRVVLGPQEQRDLRVVVEALPRDFELLVTDEAGAPLDEVSLRVVASVDPRPSRTGQGQWARTDAAGRAVVKGVYAPAVDVTCEKDSYLTVTRTRLVPGIAEQIVMRRGRSLTLHCRSEDGRPALSEGAWWSAEDNGVGEAQDAVRDEDEDLSGASTWRFDGLPAGIITITAKVGGREFALEHDTADPEATLVVPAWGGLVVRGLGAAKDRESPWVVAVAEEREDTSLSEALGQSEVRRDRAAWPTVFPGRYVVRLTTTTRTGSETLAGPVVVEVRAGETTEVTLR